MSRPAVFLDRDGTLIEHIPYLYQQQDIKIIPESIEAIRLLNHLGILAIVITNQSIVARGYCDEKTLQGLHTYLETQYTDHGVHLDAIYYCPHYPPENAETSDNSYRIHCNCRKPLPGLVEKAQRDYQIDMTKAAMIGDAIVDIKLAHNLKIPGILVPSLGQFNKHQHMPFSNYLKAQNILQAVELCVQKFSVISR